MENGLYLKKNSWDLMGRRNPDEQPQIHDKLIICILRNGDDFMLTNWEWGK